VLLFVAVIMVSWCAAPFNSYAIVQEIYDSAFIECKSGECTSCFRAWCKIDNHACVLRSAETTYDSQVQNCTNIFADPAIVLTFEAQGPKDGLYFIQTDKYAWWKDHGEIEGWLSWQVYEVSHRHGPTYTLIEAQEEVFQRTQFWERVDTATLWSLYITKIVSLPLAFILLVVGVVMFVKKKPRFVAVSLILAALLILAWLFISIDYNFECSLFNSCVYPA